MSTSNNINDYCFPSFDANEIKEDVHLVSVREL